MNIVVHGATGSQGAPVAALLTEAGHTVRPATRADLEDRASLEAVYPAPTPSSSGCRSSTTSACSPWPATRREPSRPRASGTSSSTPAA